MSVRSTGPFTILVVDDDPSVLACYAKLLARSGYNVLTQSDPRSVLSRGDMDTVDLVMLDYRMPGMDGLTLLERLRKNGLSARCILLSAFLNDDVRVQAAASSVDRVLDKPVDVARLRAVLTELLPTSGDGGTAAPDIPLA